MIEDTTAGFSFPAVARNKVRAGFDGGELTSDGGVMLLFLVERRIGVAERLARPAQDGVGLFGRNLEVAVRDHTREFIFGHNAV
jgi:hypothetical protein